MHTFHGFDVKIVYFKLYRSTYTYKIAFSKETTVRFDLDWQLDK